MSTIAIIGAGQLGSRHLQALACLPESQDIWVVDAAPQSLDVAAERWAQMPGHERHAVQYIQSVDGLPEAIDVCVIATGAGPRAAIVRTLADHATVRYLVLEKVLFQKLTDYDTIGDLLASRQIPAWVNCPRRMFDFYKDLKARLHAAPAGPVHMQVSGGQWGLGCNGVHFLDLYAFLSGDSNLTAAAPELDPEVIASKRAGAVEFTGRLTFNGSEGGRLSVESLAESDSPIRIVVERAGTSVNILESAGSADITSPDGREEQLNFTPLFQSQLTDKVVMALLERGDCDLTPYKESTRLHLAMLPPLMQHYNQYHHQPDNALLPIT